MNSERKWYHILYPISAYVLWGSLFAVTKYTSGKLSIPVLAFSRSLVACIALYAIVLYKKQPLVKIQPGDKKYFIAAGLMGYYFNTVFNMAGVKYAGATLSSFITIINPFTISILAALILKEKLTWWKLLCIALAIGGVLVTSQSYVYAEGAALGIFLILCSVINWSFASVYIRLISGRYDALIITLYGMVFSMVLHVPTVVIDQIFFSDLVLDVPLVLCLVYMGVVGTALTMLLWNKSLSVFEASTCSLFFPIQSFVAAFLGALLFQEEIRPVYYVGVVMCTTSIILNFVFSNRSTTPRLPTR